MSLKICSLFSGSSGNCTYVAGGDTRILIDAGVALGKIEKALKVLGTSVCDTAILITHSHSDHIGAINSVIKKYPSVKIYAHTRTVSELVSGGYNESAFTAFDDQDFYVGDITVKPIALSHDVFCVGFCLLCNGKKISYLTDTGYLPQSALRAAEGSDLVMIECNHSPELLACNKNYSRALKARIHGVRGHLSNEDCSGALVQLARSGARHFILAHLSKENNYPELAYEICHKALLSNGITDAAITVASPDRLSSLMEIV